MNRKTQRRKTGSFICEKSSENDKKLARLKEKYKGMIKPSVYEYKNLQNFLDTHYDYEKINISDFERTHFNKAFEATRGKTAQNDLNPISFLILKNERSSKLYSLYDEDKITLTIEKTQASYIQIH